jgi:ribosomal-protein-alanine N-acetyltransferase
MIERATRVAVGQMGFKGLPVESGMIELGYGVNRSCWNRGYATEMARALVDWALGQPMVKRVTAMCLDNNAASIRVLEKTGFRRIGRRTDEEGMLICWERLRASRGLRSGGAG